MFDVISLSTESLTDSELSGSALDSSNNNSDNSDDDDDDDLENMIFELPNQANGSGSENDEEANWETEEEMEEDGA
jgi:hypothetical protein